MALRLYGFNPFPLRDFPYLVSLAGAEKITLSYYIASNEARVVSVATLRNVVLPLAQCGYSNSMPMSIKGSLLLLCVAEQYRGAVELCETEGLRKNQYG